MSFSAKPIHLLTSLIHNIDECGSTLSCLFFGPGAGRDVHNLIFEFLSMGTLASFGGVDRESQAGVQGYVRHRLRRLLKPFLGSVNIDSFFDLLRENNGAVIGSVALKLVMNGCSTSWNPCDLNIGTPRNRLSVFSEWLRHIDYKFSGTGMLWREVAGALTHTIYVNSEVQAITVTETKETDSFLGAIVGAIHTATMNFITSEHVGSLYLAKTLKNRFSYAYRTPLSPSQKSALL